MSEAKTNNCVDCNRKTFICKFLNESELEQLDKNRQEVKYESGETIFKQGTSITSIIILHSGLAKIFIEGINGRKLILQHIKPSEFVGGPGLFIDGKHYITVSAITECIVCHIDAEVFKEIIRNNNELAYEYIVDISKKGVYNFNRFICLTQKQMHGRIADAIIYYTDVVYDGAKSGFSIPRQDFAEITGMNKDSASRIIKELKENKVIEINEGRIEIINRKLLEQISEFG